MAQSSRMRPTRYAHFEGHTDLCYSHDGRYIITCGSDGEVRVFEGLDDDDCKTHMVADCAHAIAYRDGRFLVSTDSNMVNAFTLDDGSPDGIITRFTGAPATHITVSPGGDLVACAGSDMTIRVHDPIAYKDKEYTGHQAPVLSVALDPKGQYLASSSCDGSVRVWVRETSAVEVSWAVLPKSNSFSASPTLCRLSFTPSGTFLLVPVGPKVLLYARDGWRLIGELSSERVKETISIVAISPCGTLVAGGCVDGTLAVWSLDTRGLVMVERHPKGLSYSGVAWNPSSAKKEIAFVDVNGQLGTVVDVPTTGGIGVVEPSSSSSTPLHGLENGFGGADDSSEAPFPPLDTADDDGGADDDGDDEFSISKIKAQLGFADDEEGTFLGLPSSSAAGGGDEAGAVQQSSAPAAPRVEGMRLPEVQKPFQPGMTPEHLTERYMLWNNVGVVRQYSGEDESSIDVEFHDSSIHHSLHINNTAGHSMAALSTQVLALAAEGQEDQPSKLVVQQLSGGSKEWHIDMSEGEDILALAVGTGWIAAATDRRNLRVFGTSGTQRELMALPGPVVCLAGLEDMLLVVCHSGVGVAGDQCMSALVLCVGGERHPVPQATPLPLSPRAYLAWAGFTDEGTPLTMDSYGVVRLMNYSLGYNWTSILNTRAHARSKTDHYFLVGASEMQGNVRCVFCKGARYPPTLPKPHVTLLDIRLPLCEADTEKGELEEQMARTQLTLHTLTRRSEAAGADDGGLADEQEEAERRLQEAMIKLFALACRSERECRAVEVCRLMPSVATVQLAIKYSAKLHRLALAERLGGVAAAKVEEEGQRAERRRRHRAEQEMVRYGQGGGGGGRRQEEEEEEEEEEDMEQSHLPSLTQEEEEEEEEGKEEEEQQGNPLLAAARRKAGMGAGSLSFSLLANKNPFKKPLPSAPAPSASSSSSSMSSSMSSSASSSASSFSSSKRGIDVIDSFRRAMKKESPSVLRPVLRKPQNKQKKKNDKDPSTPPSKAPGKENQLSSPQATPNPFRKPQGGTEDLPDLTLTTPATPVTPKPKRSALQMWMEDNMDEVRAAHPEVEQEKELLVKAALMFKDQDVEVKQKYKTLASAPTPTAACAPTPTQEEERKRPREEEEEEEGEGKEEEVKKKSKGSGLSKLSAFVFATKDS
ncbi:WD repeat and HMG-box DNA-binding protein 1-like [Eriocheir sinensis]|uniref:WD repeat and HMG-box DNA-binding protein 1-like n=1 Tax=Eriocheir sinensis TaxID=95602 RepID=UPI0021CA161A|nr:WD repeat and HMG-box DNA-binding protein 1-like [Eriocheir sinensis]